MMVTCAPHSKVKLWKQWFRDNFENRPVAHFWKSLKKGSLFKLFWKKGPFSNWVWTNTLGQRPGGPGQGLGPRPQRGMFLSNYVCKWTPWKMTYELLRTFLKIAPRPIFKIVTDSVFQSFTFEWGAQVTIIYSFQHNTKIKVFTLGWNPNLIRS